MEYHFGEISDNLVKILIYFEIIEILIEMNDMDDDLDLF